MRYLLLAALLLPAICSAAGLSLIKPAISVMEDGVPEPPGFEYVSGQTIYFTCRISEFAKTTERQIHLTYSVQAFDPKGVPLDEPYKNQVMDEVLQQDKDWLPKIATGIAIPPLVLPGEFKIVVKAEDVVGKTSAELAVPFRVRGRMVEPSETLTVRNLRFYKTENDTLAMTEPVYRAGDDLWSRFDITGYKYGAGNKISVSYTTSILGASGTVLWKQQEPAREDSESFYPKPYVPATMSLSMQKVRPGTYTILIQASDEIGNQTTEARQSFTVQPAP